MRGLLKFVIGIVLLAVILAGAAEFAARYFIGNQISDQVKASTDSEVTTSFGTSPVLPALATDTIPEVTVSLDRIRSGDIAGTRIDAHLKDLNIADRNNPVAHSVSVEAFIPPETIQRRIQAELDQQVSVPGLTLTVDSVQMQPEGGTLVITLAGGAATVTAQPTAANGTVTTQIVDSTVFGIQLPEAVNSAISSGTQQALQNLPASLTATAVTVEPGGVRAWLTGTNVAISELSVTGQ